MTVFKISRMEPYQETGADASPYVGFRVAEEGEHEFVGVVRARASGSIMALGSLDGIDWTRMLSIGVLEEAESRLIAGLLPDEAGVNLTIEYDTWQERLLREFADGAKRCLWMRRVDPHGSLCCATGSGEPEPTSAPLCETCDMPDARLVCSGLVHPSVKFQGGISAQFGPSLSRSVDQAYCEVHLRQTNWADCQPLSGRDCWYRIVSSGTKQPGPDAAAPARLIDEVPYLRLAYGDRFRVKPTDFWPPIDERTVASILTNCATAGDFQQRISALDALVTRMAPLSQLDPGDRVDASGNKLLSIGALAKVLEKRCGGAGLPYVERLRALHKARNSFPAHPHSDDLAGALRVLGVQRYPPTDWRMAWWQVAASIAEALASIRAVVQTGGWSDAD